MCALSGEGQQLGYPPERRFRPRHLILDAGGSSAWQTAPDGEHLTLEYDDEILSHFTVTYQSDGRCLRTVEQPVLFETAHRSPQLALWELSDDEWRKAMPVATARRRRPMPDPARQAALFA
jgi:hypothetical protein